MLYSTLFGKTQKNAPSDATITSHQLLHQAGYIRQSTSGRYFMLPLGQRVANKIQKIIKEEMDATGAQEVLSPVLHPLELWQETNRTNTAGFELMKITDRRGANFALGGTAEEMFVDVVRKFRLSYTDLPLNIYQFSLKFRDETRASGGLLRVREFIMKDAYSFHTDETDFKKTYDLMAETYSKIFERLGLKTRKVLSDNGYIGGEYCHEYVVDSPVGESKYLMTADGSYCAHEDVAEFLSENKNTNEKLLPLQEVSAVRGTTMEDGVKLHNKPLWQQIKDVLFVDEKGRFILAIIRGDHDVNEVKLKHVSDSIELRHATDDEIRDKLHSEPGFISPVGIKKLVDSNVELIIVADKSLRTIKNAYGGSNKLHKDLYNMNIDRDYKPDKEEDIALAKENYSYKGQKLIAGQGIEVGNIFQLGYHYSSKMKDATYTASDGTLKPFYMGCYGIGVGRTLAAIVETHNDDKGIVWPQNVAPFAVHLIGINMEDETAKAHALDVYKKLIDAGVEVLFDDRNGATAGEKFFDADLIGCPYRVVVSKKTGDMVELKKRSEEEKSVLVSVNDILARLMARL